MVLVYKLVVVTFFFLFITAHNEIRTTLTILSNAFFLISNIQNLTTSNTVIQLVFTTIFNLKYDKIFFTWNNVINLEKKKLFLSKRIEIR